MQFSSLVVGGIVTFRAADSTRCQVMSVLDLAPCQHGGRHLAIPSPAEERRGAYSSIPSRVEGEEMGFVKEPR